MPDYQDFRIIERRVKEILLYIGGPSKACACLNLRLVTWTLKMEGACSSKTLVPIYQNKRCHNPEDHNMNFHLLKNWDLAFLSYTNISFQGSSNYRKTANMTGMTENKKTVHTAIWKLADNRVPTKLRKRHVFLPRPIHACPRHGPWATS